MKKEKFVEVGATGLRSPNGELLKSVPLYMRTEGNEEQMLNSFAGACESLGSIRKPRAKEESK